MNKGELVSNLAKKANLPKSQADKVLTLVLGEIQQGVKKGEVRLVGFGTFKKATRKARTGRNPRTGEAIKIEKKTYTKFVASKIWNPNAPVAQAAKKATK